ncbi:MAG: hypothetical protein ACRDRX_14535 [Pseudonocardiaceae bacterium]
MSTNIDVSSYTDDSGPRFHALYREEDEERSAAGETPMGSAEPSAPLAEDVFHLLAADDDVASSYGGYLALCGEVLVASGLPPSCYPVFGGPAWHIGPCGDCDPGATRSPAGRRLSRRRTAP